MLTRKQLARHRDFLHSILEVGDSVSGVRRVLKTATHLQLRTLIVLFATAVLRKIPVTQEVMQVFKRSRKKRTLKLHFGSWARVRALLHRSDTWRDVLSEVAPLLSPTVGAFFDQAKK